MKQFLFFFTYALLLKIGFAQTSILDSCFTSPIVSTSFASTANVKNQDADMCSWNGSGWNGSWGGAGLTLAPPGSVVGTRAIWNGPNTWTTGGEGFALRLGTALIAGKSYTFKFTYVRHGWSGVSTFYPNFRTNNTGAISTGTLVGTLPSVGTAWTTASITFVANAGQAGHNFITVHAFDTGGFVLACSVTAVSLPIMPINFKATTEKERIRLDWQSEHALPQETFELERSLDGLQFSSIHSVTANQTEFNYIDMPKMASSWFYRLRKVDKDGNVTYYQTIEAKMEGSEQLSIKNVYPNPANQNETAQVTVYTATQTVGNIAIYDRLGKRVWVQEDTWAAGTHQIPINLQNIAPGIYQVVFTTSEGRSTQKLLVQ